MIRFGAVFVALAACPKRAPDGPPVVTLPVPAEASAPAAPSADGSLVAPAHTWVAAVDALEASGGVVFACRHPDTGDACPLPTCEPGSPCDGFAAFGVGVSPFGEGPVLLPAGPVLVRIYPPDPCVQRLAEPADGPTGALDTGRTVRTVGIEGLTAPPGVQIEAAWDIDLDGDGTDERIIEGTRGDAAIVALISPRWLKIAEDEVPPPVEDGDEQATYARMTQLTTHRLYGLTDANADGKLEIVIDGTGYEAQWRTIATWNGVDFDHAGTAECAL